MGHAVIKLRTFVKRIKGKAHTRGIAPMKDFKQGCGQSPASHQAAQPFPRRGSIWSNAPVKTHLMKGLSPNQGHSPNEKLKLAGGAKPRLTSGGEAVSKN
jgi:hypothetical protein